MTEHGTYWQRLADRRLRRRGVVLGAGAGATGLAAALTVGCGDDDSKPSGGATPPPSGGTTQATAAGGASATAPATAAATAVDLSKLSEAEFYKAIPTELKKTWTDQQVKLGGKSVRIFNQNVSLDPQQTTTLSPSLEICLATYNKLIRLNCSQDIKSSAAAEIEGDLAVKWERPDVNTMVFTLNTGIKWQDLAPTNGRAFTADDIKYMFDRGKNLPTSAYKQYWTLFGTPEDIGNNQVRIKLDKPHPAMDLVLTSGFALAIPQEFSADDAKVKAVGTGPFILDKATPNVSWEFKKNPTFFKKDAMGRQLPYLDTHSLPVIADAATRSAVFERGDAQWAYLSAATYFSTDTAYDYIKRHPGYQVQKTLGIWGTLSLLGRLDQPPYSDPRVREALNRLMDRQTMSDSLFKGLANYPPYFVWPAIFDGSPPGLDKLPKYQFNVQTAKQLLSAAGFPNGLEMNLQYYDVAGSEALITIYQQSLEQGGVKVKLSKVTDLATNTATLRSADWSGLVFWPRSMDYPDPAATIQAFAAGSAQNYGHLNDPTFQALYDKQNTTIGAERKQVLTQIWDRMVDQVYSLDFPTPPSLQVFRPELRNFQHTSWNANNGQGLGQIDRVWLA